MSQGRFAARAGLMLVVTASVSFGGYALASTEGSAPQESRPSTAAEALVRGDAPDEGLAPARTSADDLETAPTETVPTPAGGDVPFEGDAPLEAEGDTGAPVDGGVSDEGESVGPQEPAEPLVPVEEVQEVESPAEKTTAPDVPWQPTNPDILGNWAVDIELTAPTLPYGGTLTVRPVVTGAPDASDFTYNYVWNYEGRWDYWGSTVLEQGGPTSEASWEFAPSKPGRYQLFVDVTDPQGVCRGYEAWVAVEDWSASLELSSASAVVGSPVTVTPVVDCADASGFTYNYVWNYEGRWDYWGSTVLEQGGPTSEASWEFTPTRNGRYVIYVDVFDTQGNVRSYETSVEVYGSSADAWNYGELTGSAKSVQYGSQVTVAPVIDGATNDLLYRYRYTVSDGSTQRSGTLKDYSYDASISWTPSSTGVYEISCDVMDIDGVVKTKACQIVVWQVSQLAPVTNDGGKTWVVSPWLGFAGDYAELGFSFNYVWNKDGEWQEWGSSVKDTGAPVYQNAWVFETRGDGAYDLYVDFTDLDGTVHAGLLSAQVLYAPSGKVGYQNPSGFYQVSSLNVQPHPSATGVFAYMTPSRIPVDASREQCVEAFVSRAREYLGTPYVWNYACAPGVGVDCIGLVFQCAYACGMNLGEFNPYDHYATGPNGWHSHDAMNMWNYGNIQKLDVSERQYGDLIFYQGHVAIYVGNDQVIEALPSTGVAYANMWDFATPLGVGRLFL